MANQGKCVILLSYIESWTESYIREQAEGADYLICADGGELYASIAGLVPDCVIGDFDSDILTDKFDCLYITYPAEKDLTDCEAAILHAAELGYRDIIIIGGIGGRIDHTIGNIAMLLKFYSDDIRVEFRDMKNSMTVIRDSFIDLYSDGRYKYFGVASIDASAYGVDITGAKYELCGAELVRDTSLGISNEISGDHARVSVKNGTLLVMRSAD